MTEALIEAKEGSDLDAYLPAELHDLPNPQIAIPALAKNARLMALIEGAVRDIPTHHDVYRGDARLMNLPVESVQLVVTSQADLRYFLVRNQSNRSFTTSSMMSMTARSSSLKSSSSTPNRVAPCATLFRFFRSL